MPKFTQLGSGCAKMGLQAQLGLGIQTTVLSYSIPWVASFSKLLGNEPSSIQPRSSLIEPCPVVSVTAEPITEAENMSGSHSPGLSHTSHPKLRLGLQPKLAGEKGWVLE